MKRMSLCIITVILFSNSLVAHALSDSFLYTLLQVCGVLKAQTQKNYLNQITRAPSNVSNGDLLGELTYQGYFNGDYRVAASVESEVDGLPSGSIVPGNLIFSTTSSAGSSNEHVRITSGGRVGLNTSTPNSKMNIEGETTAGAESVVHIGQSDTSLDSLVTSTAQSLQVDGNLYVGGSTNISAGQTNVKGKLYFAANTSYTPTAAGLVIPFDTEIDPGNNFATGSTAGFTAPADGYYMLTFFVQSTNSLANSQFVDTRIIKNGIDNTAINILQLYSRSRSNYPTHVTLSGIVLLNAGDIIRATVTILRSNMTLADGNLTLVGGVDGTSLAVHQLSTGGIS